MIPASLIYGLGIITSYLFNTPQIDPSMLHLGPPNFRPLEDDLNHDLNTLKKWINEEDG
ncbi:MAG: hypothetical protein R3E91_05350 [Chlamydiales bacterium]